MGDLKLSVYPPCLLSRLPLRLSCMYLSFICTVTMILVCVQDFEIRCAVALERAMQR